MVMCRVFLLLSTFVLLTFCKSPYKTSSATIPDKDSKKTAQKNRKELKKHLDKQDQKVIESEDLEHKYIAPSKRKKRGEIPPQETFY